jgi:ubiquinone biosynthesis protein UbiJ
MLTVTIENVLNRGLPRSPAARQLCAELTGRRVELAIRDIATWCIESDGQRLVLTRGAASEAHARVSGGPLALLALVSSARSQGLRREDVRIEGDTELVERFHRLLQLLAPDLEEELAIAIGDVPAHGIARLAGATLDWCRRTADTAVRNAAEYLAHERRDLVSRPEGRQLLEGIDTLRDDIDRLEARIELLAQRLATARPGQRQA